MRLRVLPLLLVFAAIACGSERYPAPQTVYVRAAPADVATPTALDPHPAPRILPAIPAALQEEIAGCIRVCTHSDGTATWNLMFHWPTHDWQQDAIAAGVAKLALKWPLKENLPETTVTVTETVPDLTKPPVDGIQPTTEVLVSRTVKALADRVRFVGEKSAPTGVEAPVEVKAK